MMKENTSETVSNNRAMLHWAKQCQSKANISVNLIILLLEVEVIWAGVVFFKT